MMRCLKSIKKHSFFITVSMSVLFLQVGCSNQDPKGEVLATVNDHKITVTEFSNQLTSDLEMNPEFNLTQESKEAYLNQMIQRELLIQEAMRMKLDRRDAFVRTIERYWQSTLIRDLLELKGKEISQQTYVSQEEIAAEHQSLKAKDDAIPSLEQLKEDIADRLKNKKKTEKLQEWIDGMQKQAKIEIRQELLNP